MQLLFVAYIHVKTLLIVQTVGVKVQTAQGWSVVYFNFFLPKFCSFNSTIYKQMLYSSKTVLLSLPYCVGKCWLFANSVKKWLQVVAG